MLNGKTHVSSIIVISLVYNMNIKIKLDLSAIFSEVKYNTTFNFRENLKTTLMVKRS